MKMSVVGLMLVGLCSQLSASPALASQELVASESNLVQVTQAEIVTSGDSEFSTVIQVYAYATFSNECMVPDQFVSVGGYRGKSMILDIALGSVMNIGRMCTMEWMPVTKRILVRTIYGDIMPIVTVNGVKAKLTK